MQTRRAIPTLLLALPCACSATNGPEPRPTPAQPKKPSEAEIAAQIESGRALLDAGRPAEAEAVFATAAGADGDSLRTRMWVLRAWMDQGRNNDTLDALDELSRAGAAGPDMTYLYGMAFARRAEGHVADGVTDSSIEMNFMDAKEKLLEAVHADAARYHDAFVPLAESAWFVEDLETGRWAADRAVELAPASSEAWFTRGRVVFAQYLEAQGEEPGAAADALWSEATASFQKAIEHGGTPEEPLARARLAEAATQLGNAMLWKQKGPEATDAYATAIAWNPAGFDYFRAVELLGGVRKAPGDERPCGFRAALEQARERMTARGAPDDEGAGLHAWWLGWGRFTEADWAGCEEAFQRALALTPEFTNSWFYIGLARQYRKDSEGALQAMHAGWDLDPADMVQTAAGAGGALRAFESLLGWCAEQKPARNLDAAFLAEMLAQAMPDEPRHWNNLGLFLRDEGERLERTAYRKKLPEPDPALLEDLYSRAYAAYKRALALTPDDPQLLNDTALMLDYHRDGDPADVELLYRHALALVEERLASPDLTPDDRTRFEQTLSDIGSNLKFLLEPMPGGEIEKDPEAEAEAAKEDDAAAAATPASTSSDG